MNSRLNASTMFTGMGVACLLIAYSSRGCANVADGPRDNGSERLNPVAMTHATQMLQDGQSTFRFDTFGDQAFWGDALRLQEAIAGESNGGVGPGLTPAKALELGLKVDLDALDGAIVQAIQNGTLNLESPTTSLDLLRADAIIGITGFFDANRRIQSLGIQCALCHSTVDDALMPGIGHRLDGWANRDLDIGAIIALAPTLQPFVDMLGVDEATVRAVLKSWGPGKFDATLALDGQATRLDGEPAATLIPPAFGLAGVNLQTWTGWGGVAHWNGLVANVEMHGQGTFFDPRLDDAERFPVAARNNFGNIRNNPDLITSKLASLHFYQLALPSPTPPVGSIDAQSAARGKTLFEGKSGCNRCHVPPLFTEPGWNMHSGAEIGIDDFQANRSPDRRYRTAPLKGLWTHTKGGFYHDGRFKTLDELVAHYDGFFAIRLTKEERADIVEYLRSI